MAMDFIAVQATNAYKDLLTALVTLDSHFLKAQALRGDALYREDLEGVDPNFRDGQQIVIRKNGILPSQREIADWKSASIEYYLSGLRSELLVASWSTGFLNIFVRVDLRDMRRLNREGRLETYHSLLVLIGNALGCNGGLGDVELELRPFSPESFPNSIFRNESKGNLPAALGLLSASRFSERQISEMASGIFEVERISGYILLKGHDYPVAGEQSGSSGAGPSSER